MENTENMEVRQDYALLFNTMTDVIEKLEKAVKEANECIAMMKEAQKTGEEMYIGENENEN